MATVAKKVYKNNLFIYLPILHKIKLYFIL